MKGRYYILVTYEMVKNDPNVRVYIQKAGDALKAIGFSEHSFAHVGLVAEKAGYIMETLGYSEREVELVKIAGYLHDIGNVVNRSDHSQSGAIMAFRILDRMGMDPAEISDVVMAIGNHDEGTGKPISPMAAALIIADKSDVRRSRVQNDNEETFDAHDKVNYSVEKAELKINESKTLIKLKLSVDTHYGSVMDYLRIFMDRMVLCKTVAAKLGLEFKLIINEQQVV